MRIKTIFLYGYSLLCTVMSFAQTQKNIVGQVISVDDKNQIDTIPGVVITYSDDSLFQGKNPYHIRRNQSSSDINGRFVLTIPSTNCGNSFFVAEIMGYEPVFINVDTLTTNYILINLQPKIYDISVTYNNDTVYWKCNNLEEYRYALVYPDGENDIVNEPYYEYETLIRTNVLGEHKLLPKPKIGFTNWLKNFISEGNISDSTVIEITINRKPIEINYFFGEIENIGLCFIRNEEWIVPGHYFFSNMWMRESKYNPPRRIKITFIEIK